MPNIPYTTDYLILGLVVIVTIFALFIGSMVVRYRNLQKDEQIIEQLGNEK